MKVSSSIELVWQLAAREAIAADFKEIELEHVFEALLKFAELSIAEVAQSGVENQALKDLVSDAGAIRGELQRRAIDSTRVRRGLRAKIGKGGSSYAGGTIHRSSATRALFDAAARLAVESRSEVVTARHVFEASLASPSAKMQEVLGGTPAANQPEPGRNPELEECWGRLGAMQLDGAVAAPQERQPEGRALLRILAQPTRRHVFLLGENEEAARAAVASVAQAIARKAAPAGLLNCRVIDLAARAGAIEAGSQAEQQLMKALAEAAGVEDIILYLPALKPEPGSAAMAGTDSPLAARMKTTGAQWICRIDPQSYASLVQRDKTWKELAELMHVHGALVNRLPNEL